MKKTITTAEILNELATASRHAETEEGFQSIVELCEATRWGDAKVRRALKQARMAGRLEVRRVTRVGLSGLLQPVPAYKVRPAAKKGR